MLVDVLAELSRRPALDSRRLVLEKLNSDLPPARAAALLPDRVVYHHHLGLALLKAGRPDEALPHLRQTVAAQAWNLDAVSQLGLALVALDRPAEAVPYLERVAAARPDSVEARQGLDQARRALGKK